MDSPPRAAANPKWMMLERFVFRRDDDESFPDEEPAAYKIDDHTTPGDPFSVAFRIAKPPEISRLFLKWQGGPKDNPRCVLVGAHRNLLLLGLIPDPVKLDMPLIDQIWHRRNNPPTLDFEPKRLFICTTPCSRYDLSDSPPLRLHPIPVCPIPIVVQLENGTEITVPRVFVLDTVGILSRGEEFAVAQLLLPRSSRKEADLCVLRSSINSHDHSWELEEKLSLFYEADEFFELDAWSTQKVIAFNNCLCFVNFGIGGLLLCEVFQKRPSVSYLRLPILNRSLNARRLLDRNCNLCVIKSATGRVDDLIFVDVVREDGYLVGPLTPHTGFSIAYHVLRTTEYGGMEWDMVFFMTSAELWDINKSLPREALMFPHVSMDDPNVVHFLLSEKGERPRYVPKVSVVTVEMSKSKVLSVVKYFDDNDHRGKDSVMVMRRSHYLESFLPSELPKFMNTCFDADAAPARDAAAGPASAPVAPPAPTRAAAAGPARAPVAPTHAAAAGPARAPVAPPRAAAAAGPARAPVAPPAPTHAAAAGPARAPVAPPRAAAAAGLARAPVVPARAAATPASARAAAAPAPASSRAAATRTRAAVTPARAAAARTRATDAAPTPAAAAPTLQGKVDCPALKSRSRRK